MGRGNGDKLSERTVLIRRWIISCLDGCRKEGGSTVSSFVALVVTHELTVMNATNVTLP